MFRVLVIFSIAVVACIGLSLAWDFDTASAAGPSIYDYKAKDIDGKDVKLKKYKGSVVMVVNTASKCGYTPQYESLQATYEKYSEKGFVVLGFPSNNFGSQEPGTDAEIKEFCTSKYKVTFPMFAKLSTQPGPDQSPIYRYLGASGHLPSWNFSKYVIGKDGRVIAFFPSAVNPESAELRSAIARALTAK